MNFDSKRDKKLLLTVIALLLLAMLTDLLLCVLMLGYKPSGDVTSSSGGGGIGFDPDVSDERPGTVTQTQSVSVAGFSKLTMPPDADTIAIDLYNPEENFGLYYLTFELRLRLDNGEYETLYKSGLVGAGKHIYQITLSHAVSAGEYSGELFIQPYRMSDMSPTNTVTGNLTIIVK